MELFRKVKQWLNEGDERKKQKKQREKQKEEAAKNREEKRIAKVAEGIISLGLTCRKCNGIAIPVLGTESHYNCMRCDSRFSGAKHRLGQKIHRDRPHNSSLSTSEYVYEYPDYDVAVNYIKLNRV